jgi:hypothetical protein
MMRGRLTWSSLSFTSCGPCGRWEKSLLSTSGAGTVVEGQLTNYFYTVCYKTSSKFVLAWQSSSHEKGHDVKLSFSGPQIHARKFLDTIKMECWGADAMTLREKEVKIHSMGQDTEHRCYMGESSMHGGTWGGWTNQRRSTISKEVSFICTCPLSASWKKRGG